MASSRKPLCAPQDRLCTPHSGSISPVGWWFQPDSSLASPERLVLNTDTQASARLCRMRVSGPGPQTPYSSWLPDGSPVRPGLRASAHSLCAPSPIGSHSVSHPTHTPPGRPPPLLSRLLAPWHDFLVICLPHQTASSLRPARLQSPACNEVSLSTSVMQLNSQLELQARGTSACFFATLPGPHHAQPAPPHPLSCALSGRYHGTLPAGPCPPA